ncbi:MAG: PAS domain S-box protein [Candidatus Zixiibacteriota bacterium]
MSIVKIKLHNSKLQNRLNKTDFSDSIGSEISNGVKPDEYLNIILNSLTHPFMIIDANDYVIKKYNHIASPDKLSPGKTCYQLIHGLSKPCGGKDNICPILQIKKTKKPVSVKHIYVDNTGNQKVFKVHGYPIFNNFGEISEVIEYLYDITKLEQSKGELKAREELHQIILSNISDAVYITDDSGEFTFICSNVDILFGYSANEMKSFGNIRKLLGKTPFDIGDLNKVGEIVNIEWEIVNKMGQKRIILINIKKVSIGKGTILYSCRDITERKKTEQKLIETHSKLLTEQVTLREKNTALKELMYQINDEKKQMARLIQSNVDRTIMPILRKLKEKAQPSEQEYIKLLEGNLSEVTSPFISHLEKQFTELTPREIEICNMIKNGLSSKDIAATLDISDQTVIKHRKRIRKKIGIGGQKVNLISHLNSFSSHI